MTREKLVEVEGILKRYFSSLLGSHPSGGRFRSLVSILGLAALSDTRELTKGEAPASPFFCGSRGGEK
jgi:hypothetical protein